MSSIFIYSPAQGNTKLFSPSNSSCYMYETLQKSQNLERTLFSLKITVLQGTLRDISNSEIYLTFHSPPATCPQLKDTRVWPEDQILTGAWGSMWSWMYIVVWICKKVVWICIPGGKMAQVSAYVLVHCPYTCNWDGGPPPQTVSLPKVYNANWP